MKVYQIRFNTASSNDQERWRLIEDGNEVLVSDIIINGHTYTTKNWVPEVGDFKWHISCEGYCQIINNIAYIKTIRDGSAIKRHLLKTISYRVLGTTVTFITAYSFGASLEVSSILSIGELLVKPILYFLHERVWYKSDWGIHNKK